MSSAETVSSTALVSDESALVNASGNEVPLGIVTLAARGRVATLAGELVPEALAGEPVVPGVSAVSLASGAVVSLLSDAVVPHAPTVSAELSVRIRSQGVVLSVMLVA